MIGVEKTGQINHAGMVRNYGISLATTEWIGFVDDDDTLKPEYITHLRQHIKEDNPDIVIFRMLDKDKILPPLCSEDFCLNEVGISFCLKRYIFSEQNYWFIPCGYEDYLLLHILRENGKKIIMSQHVNYIVRG